jgi:hypothetical protein
VASGPRNTRRTRKNWESGKVGNWETGAGGRGVDETGRADGIGGMTYPGKSWIVAACGLLTAIAQATTAPSGGGGNSPQQLGENPILKLSEKTSLSVGLASGVRADDNIFLREQATSDMLFTFTPLVHIGGEVTPKSRGALTLAHEFSSYARNSGLGAGLFAAEWNGTTFLHPKTTLSTHAGFAESNRPTVELRGLVLRSDGRLGADVDHQFSADTRLNAGVHGVRTDYRRPGFVDADQVEVPVDFHRILSSTVGFSGGYRHRVIETERGPDATDRFYHVGMKLAFDSEHLGKFSSTLKAGLNTRTLEGRGTQSGLGLESELSWKAGFADFVLTANQDVGTSPQGLQQKHRDVGLRAATNLGARTILRAAVLTRRIVYDRWTDRYVEAEVGASYRWNKYINLAAAYAWRHNGSALRSSRFSNNLVSVSAELRM